MSDDNKLLDIGMFEIESAILSDVSRSKQVNISMLITDVNITESIFSSFVSADITIYDTHALTDEFPIRGEEYLELTYSDYFSKRMTLRLHVFAIDEVSTDDKSESQSFIMRCLSADFVASESVRIQKSLRGTVSSMAFAIHKQFFSAKPLELEETVGDQVIVVPSFTPVETLNFFARKAYSSTNKSSNYLFFENRETFVFKTHEQIFKDADSKITDRTTFYYGETKIGVLNRSSLMNHAISIKPKRRFNVMDTIRTGAAITEVFKIDPATRSFTSTVYDHGDEFENYRHNDKKAKPYHSSEFRNKYLSKEGNVVNTFLTFEESNQDQRFYSEIIPRRHSTSFYMQSNVIDMEIHGCNDIFAGTVLNLVIPEMKFVNGDKNPHPNLSGRYLVETISHHMAEKQWKMRIRLIKDSFVNG